MATDSTPTLPDPDEVTAREERDMLFSAYLEDDLPERKREAFDARLEEDEDFREAYRDFAEVVDGVQNLPYEFAPPDLAGNLRTRMRVRSRGGFFADSLLRRQRVPYEVIAVVMLIVMASTYFFMGTTTPQRLEYADDKQLDVPTAPEESPGRDAPTPPSNQP